MALKTPKKVELPEKVQAQIDLAQQKVAVLKEDEMVLARSKKELQKEVARLELTRDTLESELPKMEEEARVKQNAIEGLEASYAELEEKLSEAKQELANAQKARDAALAEVEEAVERRSEVVAGARKAEEELEASRQDLAKAVKSFEERKAFVAEQIKSI